MKLKINRKKWLRGTGFGELYDGELSCCLGFYGRALGFKSTQMCGIGAPSEFVNQADNAKSKQKRFEKWKPLVKNKGGYNTTKICNTLMAFNDAEGITDEKREAEIKYWFKKIGVDVEFYN